MSGKEWLNEIKYFSYIMNVGKRERLFTAGRIGSQMKWRGKLEKNYNSRIENLCK